MEDKSRSERQSKCQSTALAWAAVILLTAAVLSLSACATEVVTKQIEFYPTLLVSQASKKLPLTVGVYYSPEFVSYRRQRQRVGRELSLLRPRGDPLVDNRINAQVWDIPLGAASMQRVGQTLQSLFAQVTPISERPTALANLAVDGLVEPSIEAIEIQESLALGGSVVRMGGVWQNQWAVRWTTRIRYRFALYDHRGTPITPVIVVGEAAMLMMPAFESDSIALLIDAAMQDAMSQFVHGFRENPDVANWLNRKKKQ